MRSTFYLAFCLVLAMGVGCAITDYETILDNDQDWDTDSSLGGGTDDPEDHIINTNGKAHIRESGQVATIWSNGTDELMTFVDQKTDGSQTLTTYNNFSSGFHPTFHSDFYCNPDWQGCAVWSAVDPGPGAQFSGSGNPNCSGYRSLASLLSTTRYVGECGRAVFSNPDLSDKIRVMTMADVGTYMGRPGLWLDYDHNNMTVNIDGYNLPIADGKIFYTPQTQKMAVFLDHPLNANFFRAADSIAEPGDVIDVTVMFNGITAQRSLKVVQRLGNFARNY